VASIILGSQTFGSLDAGASREWLVTDGRGGYAMGTVAGLRTRRYHALLVVPGPTPGARQAGLASLDPVLELPSGARVRLATHEWSPGVVSPSGHVHLARFELTDGVPRWRWRVAGLVLEREVAMLPGSSVTAIVHRLVAGGPVRLRLEALCTWRDAHGERYGGSPLRVEPTADGAVVEGAYRLAGPGWQPTGAWYRGAYLREEAARGLNPTEDLWYAGDFVADLSPGESIGVTAAAVRSSLPAAKIIDAAAERGRGLTAGATDETDALLRLAADAFVVSGPGSGSGSGPDVVAGYPWFGTWSRDTMIAFEGLFLATGRAAEGRELLRRYAASLRDGLLANNDERRPAGPAQVPAHDERRLAGPAQVPAHEDTGRLEYNTVDATLWFVHAVGAYVRTTGDVDLGVELLPALESVREAHERGTRYAIQVDPADGLLSAGVPGYALTWMDARIDGVPVTPRIGKPVDVNALWLNALGTLAELRKHAGTDPAPVRARFEAATEVFRRRYPQPSGWLADVLDPTDGALRPNQLLAHALPYGPLRGRPVPDALDALVTPLGLRTLAPDAPGYRGRHRGNPAERDAAYHEGTVWPWLVGPYADARRAAGQPLDGLLDGLAAHLYDFGLGSVSETADGDPPHAATGCPFQAWSVAEVLRVRRFTVS
jgi:glycogen debranching enzyme